MNFQGNLSIFSQSDIVLDHRHLKTYLLHDSNPVVQYNRIGEVSTQSSPATPHCRLVLAKKTENHPSPVYAVYAASYHHIHHLSMVDFFRLTQGP